MHRALPAAAYTDPDVYATECSRILRREWLLVGSSGQLRAPGDHVALTLVGEPIVVVRGGDGVVRALSSVCRHRYALLVEPGARGHIEGLTCPFHAWRYDLTGRLSAAPFMGDVEGFAAGEHGLPSFAVEEWEGLVFVNLDSDAAPLAPRLEPVRQALARYQLATAVHVAFDDRMWACNWKGLVCNANECYHHAGTHRESFDAVLPARTTYGVPGGPGYAVHFTPAVGAGMDWGVPAAAMADAGLIRADLAEMGVYTIYPTTVLINAGPLVTWLSFLPHGVGRTQFLNGVLAPPALADDVDRDLAQRTILEINDEDEPIVESLQRGVASAFATPGVLNTRRESSVIDVDAYLRRMLADPHGRAPY